MHSTALECGSHVQWPGMLRATLSGLISSNKGR